MVVAMVTMRTGRVRLDAIARAGAKVPMATTALIVATTTKYSRASRRMSYS
jgi:hypothetical protein